ncbi:RAD55 family ATPase [Methanobacterium alcaliphilum]|uniref:RAD55 family ATPase n=1 Tax=Methanobacterium alcaliphilum TaxID=392018 RepID=UPI00200AF1F4|nr:RAD55 family ATPase [Methanobacterium alcaliphilum]MCK9152479.1 RAD55 family ATPase [Methanobacterium alcaliphilum]
MDYLLGVAGLPWEIPPGSNILLSGDLFSGKEFLSRDFIIEGLKNDEACILISTNETAEKIVENLGKVNLDNLCIVDCVSSKFGSTIEQPFSEQIRYVESPMDLTMIMVALNDFLNVLSNERKIKKIRIVLDSVSTLLMYSNLRTVFKFLHILTTRIRSTGGSNIMLMEERAHDDIEIRTVRQLAQGIINMETNTIQIKGFKTAQAQYELNENKIIIK